MADMDSNHEADAHPSVAGIVSRPDVAQDAHPAPAGAQSAQPLQGAGNRSDNSITSPQGASTTSMIGKQPVESEQSQSAPSSPTRGPKAGKKANGATANPSAIEHDGVMNGAPSTPVQPHPSTLQGATASTSQPLPSANNEHLARQNGSSTTTTTIKTPATPATPPRLPRLKIKLHHAAAATAAGQQPRTAKENLSEGNLAGRAHSKAEHSDKSSERAADLEHVVTGDDSRSTQQSFRDHHTTTAGAGVGAGNEVSSKLSGKQDVQSALPQGDSTVSSCSGSVDQRGPNASSSFDAQSGATPDSSLASSLPLTAEAPQTDTETRATDSAPPSQPAAAHRIVVIKREQRGADEHSAGAEASVDNHKASSSKQAFGTADEAEGSPEGARKRRRGNTGDGFETDAHTESSIGVPSGKGETAQADAYHTAPSFVSSRDFVPLHSDDSSKQGRDAAGGMKRVERKTRMDGVSSSSGADGGNARDGPTPSQHPTRKPPVQHAKTQPLPLFMPQIEGKHASSSKTSNGSINGSKNPEGYSASIPTHYNTPRHPPPRTRSRLFELEEAPVFYPTAEEFADPLKYIQWCGEPDGGNGKEYGIVKVVPPEGWAPEFVLDQERFRFRTRVQKLNSLSADARASLNYQEQLQRFHAQQGHARVSIPIVDRRPVDLYHLKLVVQELGGMENVGRNRKWSEVTRRLGYDEKDAGHLSAQIKRAFLRIIYPFEEFLKVNRDAKKSNGSASDHFVREEKAASAELDHAMVDEEHVPQEEEEMQLDKDDALDGLEGGTDDVNDEDTGPGKRRSTRRRTDTKGTPVTLTAQPTKRRKRKRAQSFTPPESQTSSGDVTAPSGPAGQMCEICLRGDNGGSMLLCDECNRGYHMYCLDPPLTTVPKSEWFCPPCLVGTGNDFGFDDGETHSLWSFWQRAEAFRTSWWMDRAKDAVWKSPDGQPNGVTRPLSNGKLEVSEDDVEREFWRLVHSPDETVEVEYGADVHSTTHGSALPTLETHPLNPYSRDGWNLNNLPILNGSLLRYIKSDISGMTVPWVYVGMIFSTFCWHNEDHYTYSINYQHFGDTKTWYGVPGEDADKLDEALRKAAPDLFQQSPDLLFQLVTMMSPDKLRKEGVRVYACDQRANEFVITYPKAYHSGFNHGFNLNEAVNFALPDWVPLGLECVHRYQQYGRFPVFSHDELLVTVYLHNQSVETATWLQAPMREMVERELKKRNAIREQGQDLLEDIVEMDLPEAEYQCAHCNIFCYLGQITSDQAEGVACLDHGREVCGQESASPWTLRLRFSDEQLESMLSKTVERASIPDNWHSRLQKVIVANARPPLRTLRGLLTDGEKMPWSMPEVEQLREFVDKANNWVDEATFFIAKRHHKRNGGPAKDLTSNGISFLSSRAPRRSSKVIEAASQMQSAENSSTGDDSSAELGEQEKVYTLIEEAELLPFDAPEIGLLRAMVSTMEDFKKRARDLLDRVGRGFRPAMAECEELLSIGGTLNVRLDEFSELQQYVGRREWSSDMKQVRERFTDLEEVDRYIAEGHRLGVNAHDEMMRMLKARRRAGERWRDDATHALAVSAKQLPRWPRSYDKPHRVGERKVTDCQITQTKVNELCRASYTVAVDPNIHAQLHGLLKQTKDLAKQVSALSIGKPETDEDTVRYIEDVERVLQQTGAVNVLIEGEVELSDLMRKQDRWEYLYEGLVPKVADLVPRHQPPAQGSTARELAQWFAIRCDKVAACLDPDDEAPGSMRHYCICRAVGEVADEEEIVCMQCRCKYHIDCLRVTPTEANKKASGWICPFCDLRKLPKFVKPWRQAARQLKEFTDAAISNDAENFPFGVPVTKRALDACLARAIHFQDALYSCLSTPFHPRSVAGHRLTVHLLKKCSGLFFNLETPANVPAVPFLAEVLLANSGFDADGKPSRAIPWPNVRPPDPRFAPDVLPAGMQQVAKREDYTVESKRPTHETQSPVVDNGLMRRERMPMPIHGTPDRFAFRQTSVGVDSQISMEMEIPILDGHPGSLSHDDDVLRDAASEKDDKKRRRGKRARFVFEEEVGLYVPLHGKRVYCLCRTNNAQGMVTCDRCSLWFHERCVHVDGKSLGAERWICPFCCVKTERRYPYGELKVKEMGVADPNLWLDVRCTLRSTRGPVSKLQHWTIEEDKRIVLHLESYYPATSADGETKSEAGGEVEASNKGGSADPNTVNSKYALGSVAIDPTWTDVRARVTPVHRTPWAEEQARKRDFEAQERHRAGMANLYSRGVTDAMIEKWFIGWNGKELVYPRRDRQGKFIELPLGTHIELAPDDQDGTRLLKSALESEARELREKGLPVPEFIDGPPTAPMSQRRHVVAAAPAAVSTHSATPPPLPWPAHRNEVPRNSSRPESYSHKYQALPPLSHQVPSDAHLPVQAEKQAQDGRNDENYHPSHQNPSASPAVARPSYTIAPIPPFRGTRPGNEFEERGHREGTETNRATSMTHEQSMQYYHENAQSPQSVRDGRARTPASAGPGGSFGSHLLATSRLSSLQSQAALPPSRLPTPGPLNGPLRAPGHNGPVALDHGGHPMHTDRGRPRASSSASSVSSYQSPSSRAMLPPSPGQRHVGQYRSPNPGRPRSPPPLSARNPLGLGQDPDPNHTMRPSYLHEARSRSPSTQLPPLPSLSRHLRMPDYGPERGSSSHLATLPPIASRRTSRSPPQLPKIHDRDRSPRTHEAKSSTFTAEREAELRQLARVMRPEASEGEIDEMVRHALH